jgi:hypothetical protein
MNVIEEVAAERQRQKEKEGWSEDHDDGHDNGGLADAAACYAAGGSIYRVLNHDSRNLQSVWPWEEHDWKPKDRRRDLVRAAALIVAELERMDRATNGK